MTWVKLDDQFTENPKVRRLTSDAFRLYVAGLCHCASHLTDGLVERHKVSALLPKVTKRMVAELTEVCLWLEHTDGYEVKDYLKYNPSREQVIREREAAAERKRKYKERNTEKNGVPNGGKNDERSPSPTHPDPSRRDKGRVSEEPSAVSTAPAPSGGTVDAVEKPDTRFAPEEVERGASTARSLKAALRAS